MNILIPHSWLLEQLESSTTPEELQKFVSLSGPSVERIYEKENESVYDIEVTTNRVDTMSVRGVAREAAVILTKANIPSQLKPLSLSYSADDLQKQPDNSLPLPKIVNDPELCNRVLCIVLRDVQRTPTPEWMSKRLLQIDQQVHDSVIDITNYVTHELGHPCHAFDYDKVMELGGTIIIKKAEEGKEFITLDGAVYETVGGEVVFENESGEIIDLPAIKGTLNTSVNPNTKNVLLWIENLRPELVRFASMTHGIRTVAAQLSEKNVDPHLGLPTLIRGIELYQQLCQATIASSLHDEFPNQQPLEPITVTHQTITNYLGVNLPIETITDILGQLECEIRVMEEVIIITPPTFRPDLCIPADIVEEVARIYGYHNLPSTLMDTAIPTVKQSGVDFRVEGRIKRFLANIGWQEVYTYSLVSSELAIQIGYTLDEHLKLQNPLTEDRVYLRRSLIPSLQEVLDANPHRHNLSVFEIANIYHPQGADLPGEQLVLGMVSRNGYRAVRGEVEALLRQFYIKEIKVIHAEVEQGEYLQIGQLIADHDGQQVALGTIGIWRSGSIFVHIMIEELLRICKNHPSYTAIPRTAQLIEDMTFTISSAAIGEVIESIKEQSRHIQSVELSDIFQHNYTFTITYLDREENMTTERVEPIRKQITEIIRNQFGAELVGQV